MQITKFILTYQCKAFMLSLFAVACAFVASPAFAARAQTTEETKFFPSRDGTRLYSRFYKHPKPKGLVVIVQGLQNHTDWYQYGDRFAEAGYSTLLFDRRGSGRSEGQRGHVSQPGQLVEDLEAAIQYAKSQTPEVPFHLMANAMGFYSAFIYAKMKPKSISSLLFVAPTAAVLPSADYTMSEKAKIYVSPSYRYFKSPLEDTDFVSSGQGLDWIRNDLYGQKEFTAAFLRALNSIRADAIKIEGIEIKIPMFFVLASRDRIIDNARSKSGFYAKYPGPKKLLEIDSEHFFAFTPESEILNQSLLEWLDGGYKKATP